MPSRKTAVAETAPRSPSASRPAPHVEVRAATRGDLPRIAELFDDYRVFYGRASDRRAAKAFLTERLTRDESVILLGELRQAPAGAGAEIVAFAQLYRSFSSVSLGPVVVLNDLYVAPEARRLGVASRMVDAAVAHARRSGALWLQLEAHPENAAALRLYAAKGFVPETEFAHLNLRLRDERARGSTAARNDGRMPKGTGAAAGSNLTR